jgi:actin-related protein
MSTEAKETVVVDGGTSRIRVGFAGKTEPEIGILNVVGKPRNTVESPKYKFGENVFSLGQMLTKVYPVKSGIVEKYEEMELMWNHLFKELKITLEEHPVLLTEHISNEDSNRNPIAEIMFEKFKVPRLCFANHLVSLCASGRSTGVVLDFGEGSTFVVPIVDGNVLQNDWTKLDFGGATLEKYFEYINCGSWIFLFYVC